jgi:hypothetical protein
MRICVISPHAHNNGNSTLAMLIGLEFASQGKLCCITHAKPTSPTFYKYLSFRGFADKTSTPSQIVKVLKEGGLTGEEVRDYCRRVTDNLEAFTNESSNFTQEDMDFMFKYIAKYFPHEHVIFDDDGDDIETTRKMIKISDIIVLNITQSIKELNAFNENKELYSKIIQESGKPLVVVINRFNSTYSTINEVAKWMGIKKPNGWVVLHDNPWITWATNHGKLNILFNNIVNKDARVIELQADLTKICTTLAKGKTTFDKKGGGRK